MESKLFSHHAISRRDLGLQKRPTYEELVNYIVKDPDSIRFPNRKAKILRNSFELSQLDGIGMMEINRQHEMQIIDQERQLLLRRFAQDYDLPLGDVMSYIDHNGLHPMRDDNDIPMGGGGGLPPPPPPPAVVNNHYHQIHHHHHHQLAQPINGVPAAPSAAPAGQSAPPPPPPETASTAVQTDVMNMGGTPDPAQILQPAMNHDMHGARSTDPLAPLPRPSRPTPDGGAHLHLNNLIDPLHPPSRPRDRLDPGPQFRPNPSREPTTPRPPRLSADQVAYMIGQGIPNRKGVREEQFSLPARSGAVAFFIPRSYVYRQRKVRAVAGQGEEAEARAQRAQMLSQIEIDLQQARKLAQKEKTAAHARRMLQHWTRIHFDKVPDPGIGLIDQPDPAPEIAPSGSSGPANRGPAPTDALDHRKMVRSAQTAAKGAMERLRASGPVRLQEIEEEKARERKKLAEAFRRRVKKDAQEATQRLINSRRDRMLEIQQEGREATRRRVQARRKGGAGAIAQARPPP